MRVTCVKAYRQFQPFREGLYGTSGGQASGFDSVVVSIETDEGVTGWGEMAPLGSFYSPAFSSGARAGISDLAPQLIGLDPTQPRAIRYQLDAMMNGQAYVKSAVDMACWDVTGKAAGRPLFELLGGRHGDSVALYRAIPSASPAEVLQRAKDHLAAGYRRLQLKVGTDPNLDSAVVSAVRSAVDPDVAVFADANGAWTTHDALRFVKLTRDLDLSIEQPCRTHAECAAIRRVCTHPIILDECIDSLAALLSAREDAVADGVTIKLSRVGGITAAVLLRDVAVELNLPVTIEDTGGASIDTAAILHLSISTPERLRIHTCDFNGWVTVDNASGLPVPDHGRMRPPAGAGLGVEVDVEALGAPFLQVDGDARPMVVAS